MHAYKGMPRYKYLAALEPIMEMEIKESLALYRKLYSVLSKGDPILVYTSRRVYSGHVESGEIFLESLSEETHMALCQMFPEIPSFRAAPSIDLILDYKGTAHVRESDISQITSHYKVA